MMRALIFASCVLAAGCGFEPVYGPGGGFDETAGPITVTEIQGRTGHRLREELTRTVGPGLPGVDQSSVLAVTLNETFSRLAFQPDEAASRTDLIVTARYELTGADGKTVARGSITTTTSFNVPREPFGDVAAQTEARERAALTLSRRLREQLVVDARRYANADNAASDAGAAQ